MFLRFVDREEELGLLEKRYERRGFEFFVIYGRRRIGKTALIKEFLLGKPHIYFLCDRSGMERNAHRLKRKVAEYLEELPIETNDLEEIVSYLVKKVKDERLVLVFDEFSYLVDKDRAIPSIFQVIVDEVLKHTNVFLILCGSSISMMEKGVLSSKSPLYGRKTGHIKLMPLPFRAFHECFPHNTVEMNVEFYSVLGGIPFYMEKFSDGKSASENIKKQVFEKKGQLYEEVDFLLREEMREPDVYKSILSAIAAGQSKVVDIANWSSINVQDMDKYLKVLISLGIVKKEIPVTERKSKKTIYSIEDNFFAMFFMFYEPHKSDIEIGETKRAEEMLERYLSIYVSRRFEKLIRDHVLPAAGIMEVEKVGRWWGHYRDPKTNERKAVEIDIVALNERTAEILFGECKWKDNVDGEKLLASLTEKAKYVMWPRRRTERKEHYLLVAKSFKKRPKGAHCVDLRETSRMLGASH